MGSTEDAVARVRAAAATTQEACIMKEDIWMAAMIKERRLIVLGRIYMQDGGGDG